jgi:glycosyltransferase involved in cell wall biosynthesis
MISAVVLTKNEEDSVERCLKSLFFCDEVIVVDDFSTDKTVEIAEELGATVYKKKLENNFSQQRTFGIEKAKGDWILFVDADEEVSSELAAETKKLDKNISAYFIPRRDFWWGRELKHGETASVRSKGIVRLVKKDSGSWERPVHEEFIPVGKTGMLNGFINHYPHPGIKNFLESINYYSSLRARELADHNTPVSVYTIILYPLGKFIFTYFIKKGFLDGPAGFGYSFFMSFHSFLVRAKLYQYLHFNEKKH